MTYGCPVWYQRSGVKNLIDKLQKIQNKALVRISGAFCTTPIHAMELLTHIPPIECTVRKLVASAALRFFRLPPLSQISLRLPPEYNSPKVLIPPATPFRKYHPSIHPSKHMVIQRLVKKIPFNTE